MTLRTAARVLLPCLALPLAPPASAAAIGIGGEAGIALLRDGRPAGSVPPAALAALPRRTAMLPGDSARPCEGPTLWAVIAGAGLAGTPREAVRRVVVLRGRDGYAAAIAEGEIAPAFGGEAVILADTVAGTPTGTDHLRAVVPNDATPGRSVRDLVSIEVDTVAPAPAGGLRPDGATVR